MTEKKKPTRRVPKSVREGLGKAVVKGEIRQPDLARLTAHFFEAAGGERQIARMLYEEFVAAKEGSIVRQRILDMILRATRFANERTPPVEELGQLSEEDLQRELDDLLARAREAADDEEGAELDTPADGPGPSEGAAAADAVPPAAGPPAAAGPGGGGAAGDGPGLG